MKHENRRYFAFGTDTGGNQRAGHHLADPGAGDLYIHPAGRYYTVEFRSPITGYNWREDFWPKLEPQPKNWRGQPHFKAVGAAV